VVPWCARQQDPAKAITRVVSALARSAALCVHALHPTSAQPALLRRAEAAGRQHHGRPRRGEPASAPRRAAEEEDARLGAAAAAASAAAGAAADAERALGAVQRRAEALLGARGAAEGHLAAAKQRVAVRSQEPCTPEFCYTSPWTSARAHGCNEQPRCQPSRLHCEAAARRRHVCRERRCRACTAPQWTAPAKDI